MWNIFGWIDAIEEHFGEYVVRWRWPIILLSIVVCLVAGLGLKNIVLDTTYRNFFEKDYAPLVEFDRLEVEYSDSEGLLLMLDFRQAGGVFTRENLSLIQRITDEAWQAPHSLRVDSVTNFQNILADGDDLTVDDLVPGDPAGFSDEQLQNIRSTALAEPSIVRQTVSVDGRVAAVFVSLNKIDESDRQRIEVLSYLDGLAERYDDGRDDVRIYLTGRLAVDQGLMDSLAVDIVSVIPLAGAMMLLFMLALTRSVWATVMTIVIIVMSLVCGLGAVGHMGLHLGGPSVIAPIAILTVAAASSVHLLMGFLTLQRSGAGVKPALNEAVRLNLQPIILTSLSTTIGFLSILLSDVPAFRVMAIIVAIGVMCSLVWVMLFLPAVMSFLPERSGKNAIANASHQHAHRFMQGLGRFVVRYKMQMLVVTAAFILFLVSGVSRLSLNDDMVDHLAVGTPQRIAVDFGNEHLSSFYTLQYELVGSETGAALTPKFLGELEQYSNWLREQPEVLHVLSLSDVMKRLNRSMHGEQLQWYQIPDSRELAAQYFLLYEMSLPYGLDANNIVNADRSASRVVVNLSAMKSGQLIAFEQRVSEWQSENFKVVEAGVGSGVFAMFGKVSRVNAISMLKVTAIALFAISILLIFMLRSFRMGIISIIPNLVPAAMGFGLWGFIDGEVNIVISLIATMTLGIVVDDSVHFMSKYNRARREQGLSADEAVVYSFSSVGQALIVTSLMLVAGFFSLYFSEFQPNIEIGVLTSIVIVFALIADFFFLPPILLLLDRDKAAVVSDSAESTAI